MNPDHSLAQAPTPEPSSDTPPETPSQPEEVMPRRQLIIQPINDNVVPDPIKEQPKVEEVPEHVEPISYTESVAQAAVVPEAPKADAQQPAKDGKFVPDPKILPPVKESKSGMVLGILLAIVLVGGGAGGLYYYKNMYVSAGEYKTAASQIDELKKAVSVDANTVASSEAAVDAFNASYATFKQKNESLKDTRALTIDDDVKARYDVYSKKSAEFIAFMDKALPSMTAFQKAALAAKTYSADTTLTNSEKIQKTIAAYETIGDVADPTVKTGVDAVIAGYKDMLADTKITESKVSNAAKLAATNDITNNVAPKITGALDTMTKTLATTIGTVSPVDSLQQLSTAVAAKYAK